MGAGDPRGRRQGGIALSQSICSSHLTDHRSCSSRTGWIAGSSPAMTIQSLRSDWKRVLSARWTAPLVEPGAVVGHLRALRRRGTPLARRCLVALVRRAPPQLDAVVQIVRHLQSCRTVDHVLERERPGGAIAGYTRTCAPPAQRRARSPIRPSRPRRSSPPASRSARAAARRDPGRCAPRPSRSAGAGRATASRNLPMPRSSRRSTRRPASLPRRARCSGTSARFRPRSRASSPARRAP